MVHQSFLLAQAVIIVKIQKKVRQLINQWMRSSESGVDGIIDFENAVADPANPQNLLAKYTNKDDGIHPYNGYQVMANAIDLNLFQ